MTSKRWANSCVLALKRSSAALSQKLSIAVSLACGRKRRKKIDERPSQAPTSRTSIFFSRNGSRTSAQEATCGEVQSVVNFFPANHCWSCLALGAVMGKSWGLAWYEPPNELVPAFLSLPARNLSSARQSQQAAVYAEWNTTDTKRDKATAVGG